jgi:hypothetical protein
VDAGRFVYPTLRPAPLTEEFRNRLWIQLHDQCGDRLGELDHHQDPIGGGLLSGEVSEELALWRDCAWLASMTCALSLAGLANSPRLDAVCAACREVDWWWPLDDAVALTDRPTVISGPALAYADGFLAAGA